MGKKSETKKPGSVHRRTFPGVRLDAALEFELRQAEALTYPVEWQDDGAGLEVSRSWIEGTDYRQIFKECTPQDRILYSQGLFTGAHERLEKLRHGAVHPGNVLHVGNSPVFLDPVANAARLGATGGTPAPTYAVWLWASRVPPSWEVHDWDRVNLLRMAALLARGPASWEAAPALTEAVELCRGWAERFKRELPAGDDRSASLSGVLELLDRLLVKEPESSVFETVSQLLDGVFKRQGGAKILHPADEAEVRSRAQEQSAGSIDEILAVELLRLGGRRQSELRRQAEAFLDAGKHRGTRYVRRSARHNAERLYQSYGVAEEEAISEVRELIKDLGLLDEAEPQSAWAVLIDEYLQKHCKRGYSPRHFRKMVAVVSTYDLPSRVAETQLRRYLEHRELRERRGFLGIG